jgi:hypothetical protein
LGQGPDPIVFPDIAPDILVEVCIRGEVPVQADVSLSDRPVALRPSPIGPH